MRRSTVLSLPFSLCSLVYPKNLFLNFSGSDMDHECLRTDGISSRYKNTAATTILPEYGCLIVSPANLWKRDAAMFQVPCLILSLYFLSFKTKVIVQTHLLEVVTLLRRLFIKSGWIDIFIFLIPVHEKYKYFCSAAIR